MNDSIYFNGHRYVSAADASRNSGLSRDYVSKLCRDEKLLARRIGKNWYVEDESFRTFLLHQEQVKIERRDMLSQERMNEYRSGISSISGSKISARVSHTAAAPARADYLGGVVRGGDFMSQATSFTTTPGITDALRSSVQNSIILPPNFAIPMTHVPVHVITPVSELVHKIAALAFAITLTLGTYAIVNPKFGEYAAGSLRSAGHSIADTYTTTSNDFAMAMLDGQQTLAYAATDPKAFAASASDAVVF